MTSKDCICYDVTKGHSSKQFIYNYNNNSFKTKKGNGKQSYINEIKQNI